MFTTETLEARRLLAVAVGVVFDPITKNLEVIGTRLNDDLRVTIVPSETTLPTVDRKHPVVMNIRPGPTLDGVSVYSYGELIYNSVASHHNVRTVDVYGNDGFDAIDFTTWQTQTLSNVYGGPGDDWLNINAAQTRAPQIDGGDGNDIIFSVNGYEATLSRVEGGAGNDVIDVLAAVVNPDVVMNNAILGGEDDDLITLAVETGDSGFLALGGAGNDIIYGSTKADQLFGEEGDDVIFAGAGNDFINGGLGDDQLFGEDGDDYLDHGGGADWINGGAGHDVAFVCGEDKIFEVEVIQV
jgi:Ca2+-binding RTX toxin-like protein